MRRWWGVLSVAALAWGCSTIVPPSARWFIHYHPAPAHQAAVRFGDEFTELDDPTAGSLPPRSSDTTTLERARTYYLHALHLLEGGDTAQALIAFEHALSLLHTLANSPTMRRSAEFSELAQSVLEDYEAYLKPEQSALDFLLVRNQLLEALDRVEAETRLASPPTPPPLKADAIGVPATIIPLPRNEFVERALEFFTQGRGRRFMQRWLQLSGRYFPLMRRILREENMPEEVLYLSMIESGLNPFAVSWAGAVGLWQFIRSTGELYGLRVTTWIDERRDPEKSTRAALRHLRDLYTEFGDWHLALAAYNCGAQAVRRALAQAQRSVIAETAQSSPSPTLSFWDIRDYLPRETRNYVPLYIATTLIALNPRAFGFSDEQIVPEPELVYDTYALTELVNLPTLARCLNITLDSLRQLNPELLTLSTPPDIRPYPLKIPLGSATLLQQCLLTLSPAEKQPWLTHVVRRGETLERIAARYGVPVGEIRRLNRIGRRLRPGTALRIPVGTSASTTLATLPEAHTAGEATPPPPQPTLYHVVRQGETLAEIAARYNVSVADLKAWNSLRSDRIHAGQRLRLSARVTSGSFILHRVRRGETAHSIAQRYGVTVEHLRRWNPQSFRGQTLLAGTTLRIMVPPSTARLSPPRDSRRIYTVRAGDTLFSIARRFGVSVEELRKHNGLEEDDVIRVGQHLHIPN